MRSANVTSHPRSELARTAAFRTQLRRFLHQVEAATHAAGLTPQRYDLLLMIKAAPDGSESSTVSRLCTDLDLRQNAVTELVKRSEEAGLVRRAQSAENRRVYEISLTAEGEARLLRVFDALTDDRNAFVEDSASSATAFMRDECPGTSTACEKVRADLSNLIRSHRCARANLFYVRPLRVGEASSILRLEVRI
jgi:DNA-binding MarR family transcriptional regulator